MLLEKLLKVVEDVGFEGHAFDRLSKKITLPRMNEGGVFIIKNLTF